MSSLKKIIRKMIYHYRENSADYISHMNSLGAEIDPSVTLYNAPTINIDEQYPYLIHIGKNVNITEGVTIVAHDYSWSVPKAMNGALYGAAGEVVIGDNVFIGRHAIILKGVHIGENSIVGAGAVVSKDIPANEVWGAIQPKEFVL